MMFSIVLRQRARRNDNSDYEPLWYFKEKNKQIARSLSKKKNSCPVFYHKRYSMIRNYISCMKLQARCANESVQENTKSLLAQQSTSVYRKFIFLIWTTTMWTFAVKPDGLSVNFTQIKLEFGWWRSNGEHKVHFLVVHFLIGTFDQVIQSSTRSARN